MKHQATFTAISLKEQATIIGGEDKKPRPKTKTVTKKGDVTIGNGNKVIINIFTFDF
jgi:hypothetical protein